MEVLTISTELVVLKGPYTLHFTQYNTKSVTSLRGFNFSVEYSRTFKF
jgi:hypothetical protein